MFMYLCRSFRVVVTSKWIRHGISSVQYEQVIIMRKELEEKQPWLIISGKETEELITLVELQTAEADKVKTMVEVSSPKFEL